jgi:demethylmenaquinone methyltransferase/2-methoxy-6-polyprenyl-1,4-benzoquinol methylase
MKVLESAPERYDRGMRLLTFGRLEQLHRDIARELDAGDRALDVGCGTGALAALLARKGLAVTGIDVSPAMLEQAAQRLQAGGLMDRVTLRELGAVDLDTAFDDASFDAIISTLVYSELSADEIAYTLAECRRILRPGGCLMIGDEVLPESAWGQAVTWVFRLPFAVMALLLTQTTTHRIAGLEKRIEESGLLIRDVKRYLAGTLELVIAERVD